VTGPHRRDDQGSDDPQEANRRRVGSTESGVIGKTGLTEPLHGFSFRDDYA
jgi:hypothetical protein